MSILRPLFVLYVVANMLVCATVFAGFALPRETVSGLTGRWATCGNIWQLWFARRVLEPAINRLYFWEPNHCRVTYHMEFAVRSILYPELKL